MLLAAVATAAALAVVAAATVAVAAVVKAAAAVTAAVAAVVAAVATAAAAVVAVVVATAVAAAATDQRTACRPSGLQLNKGPSGPFFRFCLHALQHLACLSKSLAFCEKTGCTMRQQGNQRGDFNVLSVGISVHPMRCFVVSERIHGVNVY